MSRSPALAPFPRASGGVDANGKLAACAPLLIRIEVRRERNVRELLCQALLMPGESIDAHKQLRSSLAGLIMIQVIRILVARRSF
jgi:hypothetical protein